MLTSLIVLALSTFVAAAIPAPGSCSGACGTHDPSVAQRVSDGKYFRFTTNDHIGISTASSLNGPWQNAGSALGKPKQTQGSDQWAPDVSYVDGTYYMYYAVSSFGTQKSSIGLATSKTMDAGTWTDHGDIGMASVVGSAYNSIDPNLVSTGTTHHLSFGSFWHDIYQVQLQSNLMGPATKPVNIAYNPAGGHAIEGSFVYPFGGYYYLFWSAGQCCNLVSDKPPRGGEYMIKVCRSQSVGGPYVDQAGKSCTNGGGTILLQSNGDVYAPGGQGVLNDKSHGPVLYYHYFNTKIGISDGQALFGWNPLSFSTGWPVLQACA